MAMANMARVDVGLDEASPTYELNWLRACPSMLEGGGEPYWISFPTADRHPVRLPAIKCAAIRASASSLSDLREIGCKVT